MEKIKVFCDDFSFVVESAIRTDEAKGTGRLLKLKGTFQQGNFVNGNGRVYPTELLIREVGRYQKNIKEGSALGKAYHPSFWDGGAGGATDISHRVSSLAMEGDLVKGELVIFETTIGKDIAAIVEGGGQLSISSRGYGSSKREKWPADTKGAKEVSIIQDDYKLEAFDIVINPSVKKAKLSVSEALERMYNSESSVVSETRDSGDEIINNNDQSEGEVMTRAEFKEKYPKIYTETVEFAEKQGKKLGESDARSELKAVHESEFKVVNDAKVESAVKVTDLIARCEKLEADKKNLEVDVEKTKEESLKATIKAQVDINVAGSVFKASYSEAEMSRMYAVESLDAAKIMFEAYEALMTKVTKAHEVDVQGVAKVKDPDVVKEGLEDAEGSAVSPRGISESDKDEMRSVCGFAD